MYVIVGPLMLVTVVLRACSLRFLVISSCLSIKLSLVVYYCRNTVDLDYMYSHNQFNLNDVKSQ